MLNVQQLHENCLRSVRILKARGVSPDSEMVKFLERRNGELVAAYYRYKTVAELELAVKACWR